MELLLYIIIFFGIIEIGVCSYRSGIQQGYLELEINVMVMKHKELIDYQNKLLNHQSDSKYKRYEKMLR